MTGRGRVIERHRESDGEIDTISFFSFHTRLDGLKRERGGSDRDIKSNR